MYFILEIFYFFSARMSKSGACYQVQRNEWNLRTSFKCASFYRFESSTDIYRNACCVNNHNQLFHIRFKWCSICFAIPDYVRKIFFEIFKIHRNFNIKCISNISKGCHSNGGHHLDMRLFFASFIRQQSLGSCALFRWWCLACFHVEWLAHFLMTLRKIWTEWIHWL